MDVLSEVLRVIRLSGAVHLRAQFSHPWSILSSPRGFADRLKLTAASMTAFHVCVEGSCFVRVGSLPSNAWRNSFSCKPCDGRRAIRLTVITAG
jgi:AraC family transcriptional regulator, alkane utilization regulator